MVKRIDIKKILEDEKSKSIDTGVFEETFTIKMAVAGKQTFKVVFADNFGFNTSQDLLIEAK